jgi:hypothetical protein
MFEGTRKALAELQRKLSEGGVFPTPAVKSYEYSDMKPFFNKDDPKTDLAVAASPLMTALRLMFHLIGTCLL